MHQFDRCASTIQSHVTRMEARYPGYRFNTRFDGYDLHLWSVSRPGWPKISETVRLRS